MIIRQSIIDRLESNVALPLTLVSANTGCGKSVAASQWLDQTSHKFGWLSIDEEHNNSEVLLAYLEALLKDVWPEKTFGIEYLKDTSTLPASLIASALLKDLDELDEPFILVLDDYHVIQHEKIHEIFDGVLKYPSEKFHLVILTRIDPPLKLTRLRAQFRLNELRMKDLAFAPEEALALRTLMGTNTSDEQVAKLVINAEGWVTGVAAGLMGLSEGIGIDKVVQALYNKGSVISDLLDEVVLTGLSGKTIKFLKLTALFDRFSEGLISALIEAINDKELMALSIAELIRNSRRRNFFLIPLDGTGEWYRYHHFFRSQIRQREGIFGEPDMQQKIFKAASRWFEKEELLEEALHYAIRSGDMEFAMRLFARIRHELLNDEQLQRLDRLSNQFPEDVRNNSPELLINLAMVQNHKFNYGDMHRYLLKAAALLKGLGKRDAFEKQLTGEYHGISTNLWYMLGDYEKAISHGEKCMELLPAGTPNFYRELGVGWYVFSLQACGRALEGMNRLSAEYQSLADTDSYFYMRLLQGKLIFYLFEADTTHLYREGSALASLCSPKTHPGSWLIALYSLACHSYLNNHLEKTSSFHEALRLHRYAGRPFWVMHLFFLECLSGMAKGQWQQVEQCLAECEELAEELGMESLKGLVKSFQVEYYLRSDRIERAMELSVFADFEPHPLMFFYFIPQLTEVKLLLQSKQEQKGMALLERLLQIGRTRHNKNLVIQALALQAAFHAEAGNTRTAVKVLLELLTLTRETGNTRTFLDHGPAIEKLLKKVVMDPSNNVQITLLLKAFEQENKVLSENNVNLEDSAQSPGIKLSTRESEILALVTQGFRNDEIAEKLFVSLDTVKKHLYHAYQKLDVKNRVSAIKKMQILGRSN